MPHLIFNSATLEAKLYNDDGYELDYWVMHDQAIYPGFGHWGRCPRGTYTLGEPIRKGTIPFGHWFIPVENVPGREGIGIHGGGSGLPDPMAPEQSPPWEPTEGCFRMRNIDLGMEIPGDGTLVKYRQRIAGEWKFTVVGP